MYNPFSMRYGVAAQTTIRPHCGHNKSPLIGAEYPNPCTLRPLSFDETQARLRRSCWIGNHPGSIPSQPRPGPRPQRPNPCLLTQTKPGELFICRVMAMWYLLIPADPNLHRDSANESWLRCVCLVWLLSSNKPPGRAPRGSESDRRHQYASGRREGAGTTCALPRWTDSVHGSIRE
jgi:hypothetical protein